MPRFRLPAIVLALAFTAWAPSTLAYSTYYDNYCGASCHSSTVRTCAGCHSHGTHADSSKSNINVAGTLDAASYAPGATMTVTVSGGYRSGWGRVVLLDGSMNRLAISDCPGGHGGCSTNVFPATFTIAAPTTPGTYTWAVAWYGNYQYEGGGASFGLGNSTTLKPGWFTPDANNPNHGYQVVALPTFTVAGTTAPAISVSPTTLAFGNVTSGATRQQTFTISSSGTATLTGTVALAQGTSAEYTVTPATFSLAAGATQVVTVTYAPVDTTSDTGSIVVTSNDAAHPTVSVSVSGAGTTAAVPAVALSPTSLALGTVDVGASTSGTVQLQNTGTATLTVSGIARCTTPATSSEFSWATPSATPFTVAPGHGVALSVSYDPVDVGPDAGCLVVTSDDPQNPNATLAVSGTGAQPSTTGGGGTGSGSSGGGCSTGAGASGAAALLLLATIAPRLLRRRARTAVEAQRR